MSERRVRSALVVCEEWDEFLFRLAELDSSHRVPGISSLGRWRRAFDVLIADSVSGVEAVELGFEHGRQYAEIFEGLQGKGLLLVANVDVETTGCIQNGVELSRYQSDHLLHST